MKLTDLARSISTLSDVTLTFAFLLFFPTVLFAQTAPWIGDTLKGAPCTGKGSSYGPYDYTNPKNRGQQLYLVESAHFDNRVKQLVEEIGDATIISDLDYTIRAFPNHHQALYAVTRYWFLPDSNKRVPNNRLVTPPECYFQRAIKFKPDDGTVKMLYGLFFHRLNMYEKALEIYSEAEKLQPESTQLAYNIGLVYFDMKKYSKALSYAEKAYANGYPLPGLKNKLKKKGLWK
ncbi:MAG: tetratricopeptide repeat protein [Sedimenticola sp.]|uniref:Tetratricopeptide repeat protein n=1 Tax=Sedimenticola thiotaurini TaxID=1543721 RepID=A0A558CKH0_9GAMM|nr:tetratricopeptide repeat protein [Sedimenticola sp.]MCW8883204.1 tetratricopeptide repeat protein [Sedimenticola sp.]MCW8948047.1 tetratricopeptide repeat protein [Sedimenticola sp.]MCW8976804.1 tetratricopeptide repeat protein [Sedimenticola sp.]TVT49263.1 MAG: tetratricopeptide repeat protein [Sedimenticola thiotaurini]